MKNDSMNCNLFVEATREKFMGPVLNLAMLLFAIESYFMQIIDTISTFLIINLCSYTSQMGLPGGTNGKESACQCRERKRPMSNPWSGRFPKVGNANGSSILAWKIPWTEEPGGLQSMGSQSQTRLNAHTHWEKQWPVDGGCTCPLTFWSQKVVRLPSPVVDTVVVSFPRSPYS